MPSIQLRGHKNIISQNVTRCTMATVQRLTGQVIRPSYCFRQEWCSSSFIFSQFLIWKCDNKELGLCEACFRKGKCACAKAEKQRENWPPEEKSVWKTFLHITIIAASAFQYKAAWRQPWLCFAALLLCCCWTDTKVAPQELDEFPSFFLFTVSTTGEKSPLCFPQNLRTDWLKPVAKCSVIGWSPCSCVGHAHRACGRLQEEFCFSHGSWAGRGGLSASCCLICFQFWYFSGFLPNLLLNGSE